jgi:methylated-DNA-[protein]-cysteine S-methyltransferase
MDLYLERLATPIGKLLIVSDDTRLRAVDFGDREDRMRAWVQRDWGDVRLVQRRSPLGARERLERYFDGDVRAIDEIPTVANGTPFERGVWDALRTIPPGTTTTYGALALSLGHPITASRAVGTANGSNPIPIVVPCHRVIGAKGNLVGFGGGIERKRWLLHHEGVLLIGA